MNITSTTILEITVKDTTFENVYQIERVLYNYFKINSNFEDYFKIITMKFRLNMHPMLFTVRLTKNKYKFFFEFLELLQNECEELINIIKYEANKSLMLNEKAVGFGITPEYRYTITDQNLKKLKSLIQTINISQNYIIGDDNYEKVIKLLNDCPIKNFICGQIRFIIDKETLFIHTPLWNYCTPKFSLPKFIIKFCLYNDRLEKVILKQKYKQLKSLS